MIRDSDIQWWLLEARKHPETAVAIIEELAGRLVELDAENERLRDEAIRARVREPIAPDTAKLAALREQIASLQRRIDRSDSETTIVLVSNGFQTARLSTHEAWRLAQAGERELAAEALLKLRLLMLARANDDVLLLSSNGRGSVLQISEIPDVDRSGIWPASDGGPGAVTEWPAAATMMRNQPRFRTVVTRRGFVRQFIRVSFDRAVEQGHQVIEVQIARDEPRAVVNGDTDDLLVLTRWGFATRFSQRSIASQGSLGIRLEEDDEVVSALAVQDECEIVLATASGAVARRASSDVPVAPGPGARGKQLMRAFDVLGAFPHSPDSCLLYITQSGRFVVAPLRDVPLVRRSGKGQVTEDLSHDPGLAVALLPECAELGP